MKPNLNTILFVVVAVLLTLQIEGLFHSKAVPDKSGEIKLLDRQIEMIQDEREKDRAMYDSLITTLTRKDETLKQDYNKTIPRYDKIIPRINSYGKDSLRAAFERYDMLSH